MSESLLERSARYIDDGVYEGPQATNPMDATPHEVADDVLVITGFSHVIALRHGDGLALVDTSMPGFAAPILAALRIWSRAPVTAITYTHGHFDHVGGARVFVDEAAERGDLGPRVLAHVAVPDRFRRYERTDGYNAIINERQFGARMSGAGNPPGKRFALDWVEPSEVYDDRLETEFGDVAVELCHARGETDDHTYLWLGDRRIVCTGDLLIWVFPNAGNPQKVQRYPAQWASALREIAARGPELLLPAHGLPIEGRERIAGVCTDTARALEALVDETLVRMNAGETLDTIIHEVRIPDDLADRPFLQPVYDEPEFVVRNIWRLYGGWYDGNPARLKPPRDHDLAAEVAALAGGAGALARRALECAESDDLRVAAQLAEWAAGAAPDDAEVHAIRAEVYRQRREQERSLMAKGIFGAAERDAHDAESGAAG